MRAARTPRGSLPVIVESDDEEEVPQLKQRPRARPENPALGARDVHHKTPSQGSLPPQRPAPALPAAGEPGERMLGIKNIRLTTQPSAWPVPQRPAPPIPEAGKPALQVGDIALKILSRSLLERQRPAPIATARTPVAEPAGSEESGTPRSPLPSPPSPFSLSPSASSSTMTSPSWPSSPEAGMPVRPALDTRDKGKAKVEESPPPTPPSAKAGTSAALPADTGPASPTEAVRHPAEVAQAGELANLFAEDIEQLRALRVPSLPPYMDRDAVVDIHEFLGRNAHLLDKKGLLEAQGWLRDVLANGVQGGVLPGVSKARLEQLKDLSEVDVAGLTGPLSQLKYDFTQISSYLVRELGAEPGLITRRARPQADIQAERDRQLAEDHAAIAARQYPFH